MDKKIYVIHYKETTKNNDMTEYVDCGNFDYAYEDENTAKKVLADVIEEKDGDKIWNKEKDYVVVYEGDDIYEYSINCVYVSS